MKVQFNTFSNLSLFNDYSNKHQSSPISKMDNSLKSDLFVKSSENVSFTGKTRKEKAKDILEDMAVIGIVGAPFVLSIAAGSYAMSKIDTEDIFLPDGTYYMNVKDMKVESDKVVADADDGIFKVKDTPINIDAKKYDYADVANGVYKNYDGSVDIDLANNKYIDLENGIFINPETKTSLVRLSDGSLHNLLLPDLNSPNFLGCSMNTSYPGGGYRMTRQEFIDKYGYNPEHQEGAYHVVYPNDNRTIGQRFVDWFKLNPRKYDDTKEYDVFGRELITVQHNDGSIAKIAVDEKLQPIIDKYHLKGDSISELSNFFDSIKMKNYLVEFTPSQEYYNNLLPTESFSEFIHRLTGENSDVAEIVANDAVKEVIGQSTEHGQTFLETLKEIFS